MNIKRKFTENMANRIREDRQRGVMLHVLSWKYRCAIPTISSVVGRTGAYAHTYRGHEKHNRDRV